jgi:dolichol-phosphate mannosyltransferase
MSFLWEEKVLIIIPTYNERLTIRSLVVELFNLYPKVSICVVDDSSPDGTGEEAKKLATEFNDKFFTISRPKKSGRGNAVVEGLKFGLKQSKFEYFVEMDSDFSHDPKDLQRIMHESNDYDIVVGSRYLSESRIVNWPLGRKCFSLCANFLVRQMLKLPLSDCTNGYRCYSYEAVRTLDFEGIHGSGFIVLSSIAYQQFLKGFSFFEVPTLFVNRTRGHSSFSIGEVTHSILTLWKIRSKSHLTQR